MRQRIHKERKEKQMNNAQHIKIILQSEGLLNYVRIRETADTIIIKTVQHKKQLKLVRLLKEMIDLIGGYHWQYARGEWTYTINK